MLLPLAYRALHPRLPRRVPTDSRNPKRILVLNGAHIGDVVISTSILPILRSAYPHAKIGFVTGSWSRMVLTNHPDVAFHHCIDHWWCNRGSKNLLQKFLRFYNTRREALAEIRKVGYDLALCIYPFPVADLMEVTWSAGIPVRLGFSKSLYSALATAVTEVPTNPFVTQGAIQAEVLRPLRLNEIHFRKRKMILAESTEDATQEVRNALHVPALKDANYRIIHMASGVANRELPIAFWRELALELSRTCTVVFTGIGKREAENAMQACAGLANCINACSRLSWEGFVAAVRFAQVLYGVESMSGHVAAAVGTPSVSAYTGISGVARWRPEAQNCMVLTQHVPCAPCGRLRGCKQMTCLRSVTSMDFVDRPGLEPACQPQIVESRTTTNFFATNEDSLS